MHRSSCRVITGCLSSAPIPLLHIEALLPSLQVTLTHQSLSFFERALRLPSTFPIASLENSNPRIRLKKSSWTSFSRSHNLTPNVHLAREPLILCPPNPPWSTPSTYTISLYLSSPCSRKDPPSLRNTTATSHFSSLSHSDISAWTDGSVPGGLGQGGAGIHIKCTKCVTATSLSFSTGLWTTSYSAEIFAILMLFSGVSFTPRHVTLNLSPFFRLFTCPINSLFPPTIFNPQIPIQYTIPSQFFIPIQGIPSTMNTRSLFRPR